MRNYFNESNGSLKSVDDGLNWLGFFFTSLWALFNGLWGVFLIVTVLTGGIMSVAMDFLAAGDTDIAFMMLGINSLFWMIFFLFRGNKMLRRKLEKKGYRTIDGVVLEGKTILLQPR